MNRFDVDAVAFDFDGTLVDTVGDLAHAMNATLADDGCAPLARETIRDLVGRGIPHLARRAYALSRGDAPGDAELEAIVARYFAHYAATLGERSTPYPGVVEGLGRLRAAGFPLAVVTNKASRFVQPHLDRTAFAGCSLENSSVAGVYADAASFNAERTAFGHSNMGVFADRGARHLVLLSRSGPKSDADRAATAGSSAASGGSR